MNTDILGNVLYIGDKICFGIETNEDGVGEVMIGTITAWGKRDWAFIDYEGEATDANYALAVKVAIP